MDLRQIALMTPYRAQKDCLMELARAAMLLGMCGLAVATITESQGMVPSWGTYDLLLSTFIIVIPNSCVHYVFGL